MNLIRPVLTLALCCSAGLLVTPAQADPIHYLGLLNRAHDSVVAVEVAPSGSGAFVTRPIDALAGGGGSTTVRLGDAGCRVDLRLQFANGRRAEYRGVDACRGDTLVIAPLPQVRRAAGIVQAR